MANLGIVIGVVARFHDALGEVQDIHSDCIYQIVKGRVQMVPIAAIETLNSDNTFRHVIYAGLLQSLSDTLDKGRKHIIDLMKEDYTNGITRLQALVKEKGSEQDLERIEVLSKRLLEFTEEEAKGPLQRSDSRTKARGRGAASAGVGSIWGPGICSSLRSRGKKDLGRT